MATNAGGGWGRWVFAVLLVAALLACKKRGSPSAPVSSARPPKPSPAAPSALPAPPLSIAPPPALPSASSDPPLAEVPSKRLAAYALHLERQGEYEAGRRYQYWAVSSGDGSGAYSLAWFEAKLGNLEAALYWLQAAARHDPFHAVDVRREKAFEAVLRDPRWPALASYIDSCARYFEAWPTYNDMLAVPSAFRRESPAPSGSATPPSPSAPRPSPRSSAAARASAEALKQARPNAPVVLLVWLHGTGSVPDDFETVMEATAGDAGWLSVAVSGTLGAGAHAYRWSEDPERDFARVEEAIRRLDEYSTVTPRRVIIGGFSQGAQVAVELAVRHPERFFGAIALSPGLQHAKALQFQRPPSVEGQRFILLAGDGEHPLTLAMARTDSERLQAWGAQTQLIIVPGMDVHGFPADLTERLRGWVPYLMGGAAPTADPSAPAREDSAAAERPR